MDLWESILKASRMVLFMASIGAVIFAAEDRYAKREELSGLSTSIRLLILEDRLQDYNNEIIDLQEKVEEEVATVLERRRLHRLRLARELIFSEISKLNMPN